MNKMATAVRIVLSVTLVIVGILPAESQSTLRSKSVVAPTPSNSRSGVRAISTNYSVGRIPYTESVNPGGGTMVTVPIMTAPVHGVPEIAIIYNSQSGPGTAGYGWNISGASSVSITGKSIHYDGVTGPPATSLNDSDAAFVLDGIRLVSNTNSSMSSYEWVTAQGFIYAKRTSSGGANFEVVYPDGTRATYSTRSTANPTASWISTKTDSNGYVTTYSYLDHAGTMYLSEIRYGGQTASSYKGRIVFTYGTRTDGVEKWFAGHSSTLGKVLTRIQSYNGTNLLRQYDLTQSTSGRGLHLTQIKCKNSSGAELPPLTFSYGTGDSSTEALETGTSQLGGYIEKSDTRTLSYNRGKMIQEDYSDVMVTYENETVHPANATIMVYSTGIAYNGMSYPTTITKESGFMMANVVDVDGDFMDELVKINTGTPTSTTTPIKFSTYRLNSSGQVGTPTTYTINFPGSILDNNVYKPIHPIIYAGDFDGDGRTEFLLASVAYGSVQSSYRLVKLNGSGSTYNVTRLFDVTASNVNGIRAMDIDGDGRTELCVSTSSGTSFYTVNNTTMTLLRTEPSLTASVMRKSILGDINGDGLMDFIHHYCTSTASQDQPTWIPSRCPNCNVLHPILGFELDTSCRSCHTDLYAYYLDNPGTAVCCECGTTLDAQLSCPIHGDWIYTDGPNASYAWQVFTNTGAGFESSTPSSWPAGYMKEIQMIDINGDGLSDLVSLTGQTLSVYLNTRGDISATAVGSVSVPSYSDIVPLNKLYPGLHSSMAVAGSNTVINVGLNHDESGEHILTGFTDSYGNQWIYDYDDLQDSGNYSSGSSTAYPNVKVRFPMKMLARKRFYENGGHTGDWTYLYEGATLNREGLGFRGLTKTQTTDQVREQTILEERDPSMGGVTTRISTETSINTIAWYGPVQSNGAQNPRITSRQEQNLLTGTTTTITYSGYDAYNQPTKWLTSWGNAEYGIETATYTNTLTSTRYQIGLPYTTTNQRTRGSHVWKDKVTCNYDTKGRLIHRWTYTGTSGTQKTEESTWTYDSYGNVLTEMSRPYTATSYIGKTYTYSSDGTTLSSETDELGRTTSYSSYNRYGKPTSVTDYLGNTTTISYDAWGDQTGMTAPTGETSSEVFSWGGKGIYYTTTTSNAKPTKKEHFDASERIIRSEKQRFDGQWQKIDREYDALGRISRESLPFRGTSASLWNTVTYDDYDRPVQENAASGKTTTWVYDGLSTTETRDGITSTKTMDAAGRMVSAQDPGGTIQYTYRADGQPITITAPGSVVTSFTYDEYGRRRSITDPSAGVQRDSVTYNSNGSYVHKHKNANGSINTSVDQYGRVTSVARISNATTGISYTYDSYGRLASVGTGNTSHTYAYDSYGRVSTESEQDGTLTLTRTYAYGATGNMASTRYQSTLGMDVTEQYVYANGTLSKTQLEGGTVIWQIQAEDDLGHTTSALTGSVVRTYGFSSTGIPTYRKMNNGALQSFTYDFDAETGNLHTRTDGIHGKTETFGYDSLNRLTTMSVSSTTRTVGYNSNGNITSMPGVGSLYYGSSEHPYQVSLVTPATTNTIPPADQSVSYTSYHRPLSISQGGKTASFLYNEHDERSRMTIVQNNTTVLTRHYLGNCYEVDEKVAQTDQRLYLGGNYYDAPMVYVKEGSGNWTLYNIGRDYLGSVTHIATSAGVLVAEYSYDPWGRQRDPATLDIYEPGDEPDLFLGRGFTGHEHLDWCGLINMNARLYDPLYGRFLSPDPFVQTPDFSQNFNRYSYALNNPLKYTDEDGEFFTWSISGSGIQLGVNFGYFGFGLFFSWSNWSVGAYFEEGLRMGGNGLGFGVSSQQRIGYSFANHGIITGFDITARASLLWLNVSASYSFTFSIKKVNGASQSVIDTSLGISVGKSLGNNVISSIGFGSTYDYSKNFTTGTDSHKLKLGVSLSSKVPDLSADASLAVNYTYSWETGKAYESSHGMELDFSASGRVPKKGASKSVDSSIFEDISFADFKREGYLPKYKIMPMERKPFEFKTSNALAIWNFGNTLREKKQKQKYDDKK